MIRSISISIGIISVLLIGTICNAQSVNDLNNLKIELPVRQESIYILKAKEFQSEYDLFFGVLFLFYKKYVSSQDASSCSFTPSCSEYALMAIKSQGIFEGLLNFWDRFSRCNGMSPENYPVDEEKRLLIDPVSDWHYHEK
ncbi:MAG: membrane protein insertion efficiency factor YidD [Bacteroidales bacterium]|nr:membrane protein insertion efficiency factor YidD [Bacteroidales bacterium]